MKDDDLGRRFEKWREEVEKAKKLNKPIRRKEDEGHKTKPPVNYN